MSRLDDETRLTIAGALLCAAWVAFFVSFHATAARWTVWVVVLIAVASIVLLQRHPLWALGVMIAATAVSTWVGMPYGEIDLLLPTLLVLAHIGRFCGGMRAGVLSVIGVLALGVLLGLRPGAPWYAIPVAALIHAAAWLFGVVVRRRALQAVAASRESTALAAVDLERVMSSASRGARQRAMTVALEVVRTAVARMCELADAMHRRGTPYTASDAEAVRREGDLAIGRLHDALTLLDGRSDRTQGTSGDVRDDETRPTWPTPPVPWWASAVLLMVSVATVMVFGSWDPTLLAAAVVVPVCTFAVHRYPLVCGVIAGACFGLAALDASFPPDALLPLAVGLGVLVWQLTRTASVQAHIALMLVSVGAVLLGIRFDRQGVGFVVVIIVVTSLAAISWNEPDVIVQAEHARATRLMAGIAAATLRAERAERTLLARELHDGVSHGITAMSLQVGAAHALGTVDPQRARRSMSSAIDVGRRTLDEIDALAHGRPGGTSAMSLDTLIEGARASGLHVRHRPVGDADLLSYRIVQEGLTNITRYAPGAQVVVETGEVEGRQFVRIIDSGATASAESTLHAIEHLGRGRGLPGLADRVAERGGRFRAGPLRTGFEVYAEWPEQEEDPAHRGRTHETET